jgi:ABC-2 type transport system permease protein
MNTKKFNWLLKREFWEHKGGFFWAPIVVSVIIAVFTAGTILFGVLKGGEADIKINGQGVTNLAAEFAVENKAAAIEKVTAISYTSAVTPLLVVLSFTLFFYCLNALFDERKDRSVLFWKSLPVTDNATVVSKVAMALALAPLMTLFFGTILSLLIAIFISLGAAAAGINIFGGVLSSSTLYLAPLQAVATLPIYALWALPTVGWLLMVGAWARSKPFLWAVGTPLLTVGLIAWFNKMFAFGWNIEWLWKYIVGRGLLSLAPGSWFAYSREDMQFISGMHEVKVASLFTQSWHQLTTPNLWIGVAVGAAMIYAAIRLRRWKDEG